MKKREEGKRSQAAPCRSGLEKDEEGGRGTIKTA